MSSTIAPGMSNGERMRRAVRSLLPSRAYHPLAKMLDAGFCLSILGFTEFRRLRALSRSGPWVADRLERLTIPTLQHPLYVRPGSTDLEEVVYSTVRQAYGHCLPSSPVRVIVDAGANIGDSTAWYLSKFPEARVIALEPDLENFRVLEINCRPYGDRVCLLCAALWSETGRLSLKHPGARDAVSVHEWDGNNDCQGISMPDLMQTQGISQVDILKIDIEDAERALFSTAQDSWLEHVRTIAIEIHSAPSLEAVQAATRRNNFSHRLYRNLHFFSG
ncbi:MAG: FkbM family methyltransferase [Terriglobia bacterium]